MLFFDMEPLKNPGAHDWHLGWAIADPLKLVYLPGRHFTWTEQELAVLLPVNLDGLKNPGAH